MTPWQLIFFAIIGILIFFVLRIMFKPLKVVMHVFKIVISLVLIFLVCLAVFGFMVLKDANEFRKNFTNSTNLFILAEDDQIITAIAINTKLETLKTNQNVFSVVNATKMSEIQHYYLKDDLKSISKGYYKLFIFNMSIFDNLEGKRVEDRTLNMSMEELRNILESDTPKNVFVEINAERQGLSREQMMMSVGMDDANFQGIMFSYLVTHMFKNMNDLITGMREDHIQVYEETIMFKAMRLVPKFLAADTFKVDNFMPQNKTIGE